MDEEQLRIFVGLVQFYFEHEGGEAAAVGSPFLGEPDALPVMDYTGVIGISGSRRGCVYVTSSRKLLQALLEFMGETDFSEANYADLAGEIANTISGNARQHFGHEFMISVPVIVHGHSTDIRMPNQVKAYVIPLHWRKFEAALVVSLE
ncbi:MAG: hypothetical protein BWY57_01494 [Betaproteobacteria bacterium ADurb.Bin341]|nr:MAG: hypothetical protein BWY57_01494 [Betaproteobacteria bacterium ADurb.Bin341]